MSAAKELADAKARIVELEGHRKMWRLRAQLLEETAPKHCPHACMPPCPFDRAMAAFRGIADGESESPSAVKP